MTGIDVAVGRLATRASCVQSSVLGRGCRDLKTDFLCTHIPEEKTWGAGGNNSSPFMNDHCEKGSERVLGATLKVYHMGCGKRW